MEEIRREGSETGEYTTGVHKAPQKIENMKQRREKIKRDSPGTSLPEEETMRQGDEDTCDAGKDAIENYAPTINDTRREGKDGQM